MLAELLKRIGGASGLTNSLEVTVTSVEGNTPGSAGDVPKGYQPKVLDLSQNQYLPLLAALVPVFSPDIERWILGFGSWDARSTSCLEEQRAKLR